jgi:chemotaxis protein methyltransferase CheR
MSRRWRIETALASLLRERGIGTLDELITILVMGREPALAHQVVEALLNNETYFFRDRAPFDLLARQRLPKLAEARGQEAAAHLVGRLLDRQEVYSLAMLFAEDPAIWAGWTIDILGTDVSSRRRSRPQRHLYQFEVQRGLGSPR